MTKLISTMLILALAASATACAKNDTDDTKHLIRPQSSLRTLAASSKAARKARELTPRTVKLILSSRGSSISLVSW